jgi:hypothetical protein
MSFRLPAALSILLLCFVACSPDDVTDPSPRITDVASPVARVEPGQVAERLLVQLRDEDYTAAYEMLSTGQARGVATTGVDLMTKLTDADTLVREWSLEEPTFFSVDELSKVEVGGTVRFDDGGTGRVRIVMQALGLSADPWRIDEFELTRD